MNTKKVSVIVPCYNQAPYLEEALESVLNQTYDNWECIIVNDESTDDTEAIAKKWVLKDERFMYLKKENGGLSSTRNLGISKANGTVILPLDADDKIGENYIRLAINEFDTNKKIKVVYSKAMKFDGVDEAWDLPEFSLKNLSRKNMIFCSALFKKKDWELIGGYDEKMMYGWEDWEFWISLLKEGGEVKKLDDVCFYYRIKSNSMLLQMDTEKSNRMFEYLSVKHADFFVKYYGSFISLYRNNEALKNSFKEKLQSEKFVINAFTKKLFGFRLFKQISAD